MKHKKHWPPSLLAVFFLAWVLFLVKGFLYASITPLWEGIDEPFHFGYVHWLAAKESLPRWGEAFLDVEVAQSTALVPLPPLMPRLAPGEKMSYADYWRLPADRRKELRDRLPALQASPENLVPSSARLYQVQHPPLYYLLCVPLYDALGSCSLVQKVYALRLFSVVLASFSVLAAALVTRGKAAGAATIGVLVVVWPGLSVDVARVGNDSLGAAIFSLLFAAILFYGERRTALSALFIGVLIGLGLLTKAYFLTAIPAIAVYLLFIALRDRKQWRSVLVHGLIIFFCAAALAGWWYIRNYSLYGTFSGLQESIYFPSVGLAERLRAAVEVNWLLILKHLFVTFAWVSGWSFLHLSKAAYGVFIVLFALAGAGMARDICASRSVIKNDAFSVAFFLILFFTLGVAYHEVNVKATVKVMGGPGGWYFYALVLPISYLVAGGMLLWGSSSARTGRKKPRLDGIDGNDVAGRPVRATLTKASRTQNTGRMHTLFDRWWGRWWFLLLVVAFFVTELYGFFEVLLPYYAGIAVPAVDGWGVVLLHDAQAGPAEVLGRLFANKPAELSPAVLAGAVVMYGIVFLALMVLWMMISEESENLKAPITEEQRSRNDARGIS